MVLKLLAQSFREVAHGVPASGAMGVDPIQQLRDPIDWLLPGLKLALQFFESLGPYIASHTHNVMQYTMAQKDDYAGQ